MKRHLFLLLLVLLPLTSARAATDVVTVDYLPLEEAAAAVRSQLSPAGTVSALASRRMLVIDDDESHLQKARALLKRLDSAPEQYTVRMTLADSSSNRDSRRDISGSAQAGALPGGWMRIQMHNQQNQSMNSQQFSLLLSAGQPASMEVGTIEAVADTRTWLSAYGIVQAQGVELIPVTSGFRVNARPAGNDQVHIRITPWMQRMTTQVQGQHEILIDLGSTAAPGLPPGQVDNMRMNATPTTQSQRIDISGAATELTIPVNEEVEIAASNGEASQLGEALLSRYSSTGRRNFVIRISVNRH
ncbi:type II and III secretion system family protein [Mariprofundus erugo]|uniref:Type II and III secretion system family protein n=1 Tax=Mariprofundus erugo TaxID=2528639 RepID=A0A5R9H0P5_9PROT|nr:secretin N-terminal domain-containing protein [Mariprofundus erugo]TLS68584.1 type II and III secretion system family protein [Mariprofundus erugo]TLS76947.1 type II and III secretion system family protein [Mariprofundus erugo]